MFLISFKDLSLPRLASARSASVVLPLTLFLYNFAWSAVQVSLPFYVQGLTHGDSALALRWTGWILGSPFLITILVTPVWLRIGRRNLVKPFVLLQAMQGLCFALLALAESLPQILATRILLGSVGPAAALAFLIAGRHVNKNIHEQVSLMQSALMVGAMLGPLTGGVAASRLGYQVSFVLAGLILLISAGLVRVAVRPALTVKAAQQQNPRQLLRDIGVVSLIVFGGNIQFYFFGPILPEILIRFHDSQQYLLELAGWIVFLSGLSLAVGSLTTPFISRTIGERKTVAVGLGVSSLFLALLPTATTIPTFSFFRLVHVFFLAPVLSVMMSRAATWHHEQALGFVNSCRIAANFAGPVLATTLLAYFPPMGALGLLALIGAFSIPLVFINTELSVVSEVRARQPDPR